MQASTELMDITEHVEAENEVTNLRSNTSNSKTKKSSKPVPQVEQSNSNNSSMLSAKKIS